MFPNPVLTMNQRKTIHHFKAAFTLIELLVVITIIGVLAALLFTLAGNIRKKASSATSVSNLRQMGSAILSYASDNNTTLPGPVLSDHFPRYQNNAKSGQLGWLLKDHLSSEPQPDNPQPRMFYSSALDYPAARADAKNPKSKQKPTYVVLAKQTDAITNATFWPMGNYNPNSSGNTTPSMTTTQLAGRETRGKPWITEIDQIIRPSTSSYGSSEEPPHGKFRNTLMFDYSVKAIPLGEF
jgi:prepilin-type N-terminal cleavage/methylation domain-containing protein